jgi:hypothetical protein
MTNARPQSELYREAAMRWADLDAAARMLEEGKGAVLAQRMALLGDIPVSKAEQQVKASEFWSDYIKRMVNTKTQANKAKIEVEFVRMQHWEKTQDRADERFVARIGT